MTRAARLLLIPVFLSEVFFFLFIARHRFVNGDEGFYLLASRLVLMHKKPYLDFSYVQAPLLPYVYAGWMQDFWLIVGIGKTAFRLDDGHSWAHWFISRFTVRQGNGWLG